ncbi:hydroxymethylbilane synthase [bacterium SCSIO 12741]|nr:hydroxymethylbilane synthase [bacterium SCSIO 12741]
MSDRQSGIIIGTRGSDLALWQANRVKDQLAEQGVSCELKIIKTQGDKIQHLSFDKLEGKGFFTKEIEQALLDESVDLAVHSHKDLETEQPEGLSIAAVSDRENPSELLLIRPESVDTSKPLSLKSGAKVGTSSARRRSQLLFFREDLNLDDLRGNVPTRIQKLRDGQYDAIVIALAGVSRLELPLDDFFVEILDPTAFIPAPAQGVLALQIREGDEELRQTLQALNDDQVATTTHIERAILNRCQGGCKLPLGVYCREEEGQFQLWVSYAAKERDPLKRFFLEGKDGEALVQEAMDRIQDQVKKKS